MEPITLALLGGTSIWAYVALWKTRFQRNAMIRRIERDASKGNLDEAMAWWVSYNMVTPSKHFWTLFTFRGPEYLYASHIHDFLQSTKEFRKCLNNMLEQNSQNQSTPSKTNTLT